MKSELDKYRKELIEEYEEDNNDKNNENLDSNNLLTKNLIWNHR